MNLVKIPFLLINFTFLSLSLALVGFGIFLHTDETIIDRIISLSNLTEILKSQQETTNSNSTAPYYSDPLLHQLTDPVSFVFIFLGVLLFFLSFIGYCGAVKDSRCLVATFGILLCAVLLSEGVALFLYFNFKPDLKSYLASGIVHHYNPEQRPSGPGTRFTVILDYVMIEHSCCGINDDTDFHPVYEKYHVKRYEGQLVFSSSSNGNGSNPQKIPEACCKLGNLTSTEVNDIYSSILSQKNDHPPRIRRELLEAAGVDPTCISGLSEESAYIGENAGCFDKIQMDWGRVLIISGVVIGLLQLSGVGFSIFVFRSAYYDYVE